jgi:hypothetical protein
MGLSAFQDDFRAWLTRSDEQAADRLALADRRGLRSTRTPIARS